MNKEWYNTLNRAPWNPELGIWSSVAILAY